MFSYDHKVTCTHDKHYLVQNYELFRAFLVDVCLGRILFIIKKYLCVYLGALKFDFCYCFQVDKIYVLSTCNWVKLLHK